MLRTGLSVALSLAMVAAAPADPVSAGDGGVLPSDNDAVLISD